MKNQQNGFAHAFLIIGLIVALIGALGFVFWQNFIYKESVVNRESPTVIKKESKPVCTEFFDDNNILKRFDFKSSKNLNKSFVIYQVSETNGLPKADVYVTGENLCQTDAIKIPELSISDENEYGMGLAIQQNAIKKIIVSPGTGVKYIVISTQGPGDGSGLDIVNESGKYIGQATNFDYSESVTKYGMIGYWSFEKWISDDTFTATSGTGSGANVRITIKATLASVIDGPTEY